jgi:UDP-N-acetylmuramoyl-tripeptide--D-alanyl-D-alanine ligase
MWPYEWSVRAWYLGKAQRKLKRPEYAGLIRIGITGSWGKTSCKNILARMLVGKYKVAASPLSYNTPLGFTKTINNTLDGHDIVIFEMGARYAWDIKYLCNLFKPTYGILTGIGPQHIDTMKSIEVIKKTKSDLVRALPKDGGVAVINGDNEKCREVFKELDLNAKYLSSVSEKKDAEAWVDGLSVTQDGCTFMLHIRGMKPVSCTTKLLGRHNIENILMCAIMASKLGVTPTEISAAVAELEPIPHRLELVKAPNGILILDDSYNASAGGTAAAMEVLALFGGQKVVMTPGLVELGTRADEENFKFGARMAKVADKVIIVNEINKQAITDGLLSLKFKEENIHFAKTLEEAKQIYSGILKPGDVLLIANDLPDNYL